MEILVWPLAVNDPVRGATVPACAPPKRSSSASGGAASGATNSRRGSPVMQTWLETLNALVRPVVMVAVTGTAIWLA